MLMTGFHLGIYHSLETQLIIENVRTGEVVQRFTNKSW
jgi:hypothetical protein